MKKHIVFLILFSLTLSLSARDLTKYYQYIFPEFLRGVIYYKEGAAERYEINYNTITEEMHYYNAKDKKVVLTGFKDIEYISVGLRRFIPLEIDFGEIIIDTDKVALALKRYTKISGTSRSKLNKSLERNEKIADEINTQLDSTYYLIRLVKPQGIKKGVLKGLSLSQDRVVDANYNGFLKVYSSHKEKVMAFIERERIDFNSSEDIIRLTQFCNGL